ncbi:MAG: ZIP family metal transporter [Spirochaetes bacterium]|nr:MAG: ZIP family metal transporter [Spirochaetota bacterium]
MSESILYSLGAVIAVSLISLIGILILLIGEEMLRRGLFVLVSLSVGGLLGDSFIHLIPESFKRSTSAMESALLVIAGIFVFFILEKLLQWRHDHALPGKDNGIHPVGYMNLVADGLHNLFDGMLIASSFMAGTHIGVTTTLAVVLHEIPQEIGDFGILLHAGFTKRKALLFNFLSASLAILGALGAILLNTGFENFSSLMLPLTAGGFIYIAASDLIPELHKETNPLRSIIQLGAMAAGTGMMLAIALFE